MLLKTDFSYLNTYSQKSHINIKVDMTWLQASGKVVFIYIE